MSARTSRHSVTFCGCQAPHLAQAANVLGVRVLAAGRGRTNPDVVHSRHNGLSTSKFPLQPYILTPAITFRPVQYRLDEDGDDQNEYVELRGTPGEDLNDCTFLILGDGTGGSGVIESITPLTVSMPSIPLGVGLLSKTLWDGCHRESFWEAMGCF